MFAKIFTTLCRMSPALRRVMWRQWYEFLAGRYQGKAWTFMNYGFAPVGANAERIPLDQADEANRYCIQLYHHVASAITLQDATVLEVSSGRGGGSYYIKRYLRPKIVVGLDYSQNAVEFCNTNYVLDGLSFVAGDAELLPFRDNSFDAVVNVEASHCYGSMDAFLAHVRRVLRHDGHFLYADLRAKDKIDTLHTQLRGSGMTLLREANITPNVLEALSADSERKAVLIRQAVHTLLAKSFCEFAGVKGSTIYNAFRDGEVIYLSFVLQKRDV